MFDMLKGEVTDVTWFGGVLGPTVSPRAGAVECRTRAINLQFLCR